MAVDKLSEAFACFNAGDMAGAERLCAGILARDSGNADALHLQGVICMMSDRPAEAVALLKRAAAAKRNDASIFENLGLANLAAGAHADAEAALRRAAQLGARHGLLHMRLALAIGAQGRAREALELMRKAAAEMPGDPTVQVNLGNALAEAGQLEEAAQCYQTLLQQHPGHADTRFNLGAIYQRMGRSDDAARCFREVLAQVPAYADAHLSLGLIHAGRGEADEAIGCYRRALEQMPAHLPALNSLGNALVAAGDQAGAEDCFQRALAVTPADADTVVNFGNLRAEQGRLTEAQSLYERALGTRAGFDALCNLGKLFRRQGRYAEALARFQQALALADASAPAMADIASTYRDMGELTQAEAWYQKALALAPDNTETCRELGDVLKLRGRFEEAAQQYRRALELKADCYPALGGLIYVQQQMSDWRGIEALWARASREAIGKAGAGITPFSILAQPTTAAEQLACARVWAEAETGVFAAQRTSTGFVFAPASARPAKLRIGYLSWDLHEHATSYLIAELFELHDRNRFDVLAFSYGPDDGSAIRARMRAAADDFIDIAALPHRDAAQRIYDQRIDILVDLKGYTQGARPQIPALRPAPVQVNWLGYPGTMGMAEIDAIIADDFIIPAGAEADYSEKVVRLPDCYQINDRRREISAETPSRAECGLPETGVVFCCFNQSYKILPAVFSSWMRILEAVPGSVLWLLETHPRAVENLRDEARARGVAAERLIFAPRRPLPAHLARYRLADLALDTFPYTSHTTASDALWAGCPLITYAGATFASRVAGSILRAAGMPDLISATADACEKQAIELANSPARRAELRARLAANRDSCALFDSPRFVRSLEAAYDRLWMERSGPS